MYVNVQLYVVSNFIPRYRVEIFVYGNGDNASFVLLGDSGAEPIGREVSELMDNYGEVIKFLKNYTTLGTRQLSHFVLKTFRLMGVMVSHPTQR